MSTKILVALIAAALVGGCGDSSSPTVVPEPPPPVDDASEVVAFGTVSRFGSVVVNGTVFESSAAMVSINDSPGLVSDLRVGQVIAVTATVRSREQRAVAQTIGALDAVEGPIESIDAANNSFALLGRTVFFDELTVFENLDHEDLSVGNVVRIFGHQRHQERIQATHVERIANAYAAGMRMAVKGEIENLDPALMQFRIGTQECSYSAAMLELGGADLADGLYVEVSSTSPLANGVMPLDRIRARDRDRDRDRDHLCDSGCEFELEGFITDFASPYDFYVDGAPVVTSDSTVYVHGTQDSLAVDVPVAISGTWSQMAVPSEIRVLGAEKIVFRLMSTVQIEASVDAVDTDNATLSLLGIDVVTDDTTMFRDVSETNVVDFWLDDFAIGDRVEVRAYVLGDTIVATRLERDDAESTVTLKAPVEAIARPSLTMLGVTVTADDNTLYQDVDKQPIDADAFFGLVETGSLVKAMGDYNGSAIIADTLYLRECQNSCL